MVKDCITCVSQLRTSAQSWRHSRAKPTGRSAPGLDMTAGVFPGRAAQRCPDRADRDAWRAAGPVIRGSENKLKACSRTLSATNGRDNPLT